MRKYFPVRQFRPLAKPLAVQAVEDISLVLSPGHAMALVGESGSGKTTVARMLAGLYEPTSGEIRFRGAQVVSTKRAALRAYRHHVQMVFQDPFASLNPVHSVRHHLGRALRLHGRAHSQPEESAQILALLNKVSLTPAEQFIEKYPHRVERRPAPAISIARALAVGPEVLLADEPVSMLDVSIRLGILNLLLRLKREERLAVALHHS